MATNCRIVNNTPYKLHLKTRPEKGSDWEPGSYEIKATSVDARSSATFLLLNRDEGIRDGNVYVIETIASNDDGEVVRLAEKLVGLAVNSDIWARIRTANGSGGTDWVADGAKSVTFEADGQSFKGILRWQGTSWNDDLEYTLDLED